MTNEEEETKEAFECPGCGKIGSDENCDSGDVHCTNVDCAVITFMKDY